MPASDIAGAFDALGGRRAVAEQALPLALELSVLVARRKSGETVVYPPAVNHHERQILAWSVLPGELAAERRGAAERIARGIAAHALELEGILAVEMFLLHDGRLLVNELAPRPHNSFHATELACPTSQFEQLVRAVCDLPLGAVKPARPRRSSISSAISGGGRTPDFDAHSASPARGCFCTGRRRAAGPEDGTSGGSRIRPQEALQRAQGSPGRF